MKHEISGDLRWLVGILYLLHDPVRYPAHDKTVFFIVVKEGLDACNQTLYLVLSHSINI